MVQLLVEAFGVKKGAKDRNGELALNLAASNGYDSTVQLLVETLSVDKGAWNKMRPLPLP